MGGFLGIGGSGSKTDRKQVLQGYGDLGNVYNTGMSSGKDAESTGMGDLSQASGYNAKLLSGDRSSIMQALSPQISSITGQADQAKKQESAMGTARGGGTSAGDQQRQQQTAGAISSAVGGVQPQASQAQAGIGASEAGIGANLLGLGANAAGTLTGDALNSYKTTSAENAAQGQAIGQLAAGLAFGM